LIRADAHHIDDANRLRRLLAETEAWKRTGTEQQDESKNPTAKGVNGQEGKRAKGKCEREKAP
jgi:hypothetical protein